MSPGISPGISHEEIANRAYLLWQQRGQPEGQSEQIWAEAEADLHSTPPMLITPQGSRPPFNVGSNSTPASRRSGGRGRPGASRPRTETNDLRSSTRSTSADPDA